jgi:hypothetical protein
MLADSTWRFIGANCFGVPIGFWRCFLAIGISGNNARIGRITLATREPSFDAFRDHCLEHMSQHIAVTKPAMHCPANDECIAERDGSLKR